ncbi:DDHD domain-containing protein [Chaetomidium leptoderma]|uniref:DDHD domain-containing protein n=1 Tax=Chaetomidium leptoderma TaxID=669021 RepID=A0AAN6ZU93_9PEZI|nr:DDHD domain-containing protein [Chaetomidium leptoderma]
MPPGSAEKKAEKSYLSSAVDSINPWAGNRSATPTPKEPQPTVVPSNTSDHVTNPFYGKSLGRYPPGCPPLNVKWFHAVDIPKRKPKFMTSKNNEDTKPVRPKKFVAFSAGDSRAIEAAYQGKLQELEGEGSQSKGDHGPRAGTKRPRATSTEGAQDADSTISNTTVPVNEDFLFDVKIEDRELAPVYWEGPVYEARRGSWFYQEGSALRPCEENLAAQLEEGYLKIKPWHYPQRVRSNSAPKAATPKASVDSLKSSGEPQENAAKKGPLVPQHQPQTYRLFGGYMNSVVTYHDSSTAWLSSEGMLSWVTSTMYETFAGGGYMSGVKLVRGYAEPKKVKDEKRPLTPTDAKSTSKERDDKISKALKRRSAPPPSGPGSEPSDPKQEIPDDLEITRNRLTRQLSNLIEGVEDPEAEEEAIREREEKEISRDYNATADDNQGRDIEHVVLVTHGIGQLLSRRMESINFVHDVNVLRKSMKSVYAASADLRSMNSEIDKPGLGNCRVQVLPVIWRHLLDFPKRKPKRGEHDLGEIPDEEEDYPSLEDITVEGIAFARSLIADLALDVLLYQSAYREQIADIVLRESNRIYKIFKARNPEFKGKVHIVGHSLGSAIMFDILCRQKENARNTESPRNPLRFWPTSQDRYESKEPKDLAFDFEVDDFYCLGSPIGLFQMLKGRTISARNLPNALPSESPLNPDYMDDPFLDPPSQSYANERVSPVTGLPFSVSSPKVGQLFNVFHPSDPISYRVEPLISPVMTTLKPQVLPYTKKGIFDSVAPQGLTGIGAKVGQSVSGLWSSLSAGIASNLLNRSLGLSNEDVAKITASQQAQQAQQQKQQKQQQQQQQQHPSSPGAGTNIAAGVIAESKALSDAERSEKTAERMRQLASGAASGGAGATLIEHDLETLFSRFQKNRVDMGAKDEEKDNDRGKGATRATLGHEQWLEEEKKAQRLRREEMKIRALNRNGRVDYCIQESVLDFNPINTIASHMSYWADEDVSHFMLSQMLASKARTPRR